MPSMVKAKSVMMSLGFRIMYESKFMWTKPSARIWFF